MAIISITIEDSSEQVVWGIPRYVTLSTNIQSTIFYTLDGSDPTINSSIYIHPISIGADFKIILKIWATNGVDSSPIISHNYTMQSQEDGFKSKGQALTNTPSDSDPPNTLYPFGTQNIYSDAKYYNISNSKYEEARLARDDGYKASDGTTYIDAEGNEITTTEGRTLDNSNQPLTEPFYQVKYFNRNSKGEVIPGYFPHNYKVIREKPPAIESKQYRAFFDPRASVIFQDSKDESPEVPAQINSNLSTNIDIFKRHQQYCTGVECPPPTNNFISKHYNPKTNETTFYYYDNWACKWIISKTVLPLNHQNTLDSISVFTTGKSGRYVYRSMMFPRRALL